MGKHIPTRPGVAHALVVLAVLSLLLSLSMTSVPMASAKTPVTPASAGGYDGITPAGYLTTVTAEVVIPTVTCQPNLPQGQDVQIGVPLSGEVPRSASVLLPLTVVLFVDIYCPQGSSTPQHSAYLYLVLHGTLLFEHQLPLKFGAGDSMAFTLTINRATDEVSVSLKDQSSGVGAGYSKLVPGASYLNELGWEVGSCEEPTCHSITTNQLALAKFSTITFTKATFTTTGSPLPISKLSSLEQLILVDSNGKSMAKPSPLITGRSFEVTFVAST
jgi:hypothetical protein